MRNDLLLLVQLNFMEHFFHPLLISAQYRPDNSFLKECLSEFVVMMVACSLLLRLHSWNKKCFHLFSIIQQEDISQFLILFLFLSLEVFEMCNIYIT